MEQAVKMQKKKFNIDAAYRILKKEVTNYKVPVVDLIHMQTKDPYKVLVATILSARTNDRTTTQAANRLFAKAKTLPNLEKMNVKEIEKLIYPVGFYQNKAQYLLALPKKIKEDFDGKIPDTVEALITLPGVGRKTANLVVAVAFNKPAICVDTHVHRIMNIWNYVHTKNPLQTEMALRKKLPKEYWITINSILVAFGQHLCRPVGPHCDECPVFEYCPQMGVVPRKVKNKKY